MLNGFSIGYRTISFTLGKEYEVDFIGTGTVSKFKKIISFDFVIEKNWFLKGFLIK